jgi:hypothetical protein
MFIWKKYPNMKSKEDKQQPGHTYGRYAQLAQDPSHLCSKIKEVKSEE